MCIPKFTRRNNSKESAVPVSQVLYVVFESSHSPPPPPPPPPEGKIEGRRGRGRPRVTWMKNMKGWLEHTYNGCVRRVEGRSEQLEIHDRRPTTSKWRLMMIIPLSHPLAYPKRVTFPGIACHAYRLKALKPKTTNLSEMALRVCLM